MVTHCKIPKVPSLAKNNTLKQASKIYTQRLAYSHITSPNNTQPSKDPGHSERKHEAPALALNTRATASSHRSRQGEQHRLSAHFTFCEIQAVKPGPRIELMNSTLFSKIENTANTFIKERPPHKPLYQRRCANHGATKLLQ